MGEAGFVELSRDNLLTSLRWQELYAKHVRRAQVLNVDYSASKASSALRNSRSEEEAQAKKPMK